jgi:hypothetical protein
MIKLNGIMELLIVYFTNGVVMFAKKGNRYELTI